MNEDEGNNSLVAALLAKDSECVIVTFDRESKEIKICEYSDMGQFPVTESILLQLDPAEVVVCQKGNEGLIQLVNMCCPRNVKSASFPAIDEVCLESDLTRLSISDFQSFSDLARRCLQTLLSSFRVLSVAANFGACKVLHANFDKIYMQLDRACFNALNLFDKSGTNVHNSSPSSLFGLLNKCRTKPGIRRLEQWIKQPLVDEVRIQDRHEIVDVLAKNGRVRQMIQSQRLTRICDLDSMRNKLIAGKGSLDDMARIYESVVAAQGLVGDLRQLENTVLNRDVADPIERIVALLEGFMKLVETTIDLEAVQVASKFDPALESLASKRENIEAEMDQLRVSVARSNRLENLRIVDTIAPFKKGFRVVRKQMAAAQKVPKSKQVQLNKAEYIFTVPSLIDFVEELNIVEEKYEKSSSQIVKKIVSVAASYAGVVGEFADLVGTLDVLNSFAIAASTWRLTRPVIGPAGSSVELVKCRHLLVEIRSATLSGHDYIPNDVLMHRNSIDDGCVQIVTGPNMGGKSTYIRSVGLTVLMNQMGCFIPCDAGSRLPVFGAIMSRIGASDAQVRGVSTFMQEMIEASVIVKSAKANSLVIIDELGRGTSTQDGFGLAWSICSYLKNEAKSLVLFATHFHQLAALPGVMNRHVAATVDEKGLTLLYEVRDGSTSASFGTNVAILAGYPQEVVDNAILREQRNAQGNEVLIY